MKIWTRVRDKPVLSYRTSRAQMGDLLLGCGDPIGKLSPRKKGQLRKRLERYMTNKRANRPITLDFGSCYLVLCGADEVGHLHNILINERMY